MNAPSPSSKLLAAVPAVMALALLAWASPVTTAAPQRQASGAIRITVSAAASLKDSMEEIDRSFSKAQPEIAVDLNLGASGALEAQIEQGAPVDVFISAATQQMDQLAGKHLLLDGTRADLLRNELVLIVPRDSKAVSGFQDLRRQEVRLIAMGDPRSVPAGAYAQQTLAALGLADVVKPKETLATDVRQVLAAVETASADAGLVYATDAAISNRVRVVADAPPASHMPIVYPAAVLRASIHPEQSRAFLQYLQGAESRAIFERFGFRAATR